MCQRDTCLTGRSRGPGFKLRIGGKDIVGLSPGNVETGEYGPVDPGNPNPDFEDALKLMRTCDGRGVVLEIRLVTLEDKRKSWRWVMREDEQNTCPRCGRNTKE